MNNLIEVAGGGAAFVAILGVAILGVAILSGIRGVPGLPCYYPPRATS